MIIRNEKGCFAKGNEPEMSIETKAKISKNSAKFWLGKKLSKEHKKKIGLANKGKKKPPRSKETRKKLSEAKKGHTVSIKTRDKIRKTLWKCKGGRTKLIESLRHTPEYKQWRKTVFTRDNWTCQECNKRGVYLEAHHKKEMAFMFNKYNIQTLRQALYCKELWSIKNGQTLCLICHNKTKKGRGKNIRRINKD